MKTQAIVNRLKEENEDYEFYPTTDEMLHIVAMDINRLYSRKHWIKILDIGAGNGNALKVLEKKCKEVNRISTYAIEKSKILIEQMDKDIVILGTDFHQQTLIDKNMEVVFCNPPFSEFIEWAIKIIKETQATTVYLILPTRWKKNEGIMETLKQRKAKHKVLKEMTFEDSEYRQARGVVDIIRIDLGLHQPTIDAFGLWFNENFKFSAQTVPESDYNFSQRKKKEINELVTGKNIVERMVELYNADIQELILNYKKLGELDYSLLKELNVNIRSLQKALKEKVEGLKNIYWNTVFDRLKEITTRLTKDSRKSMLEKLTRTTSIDFTVDNIYAILIWVIKHANNYYDTQLVDLYYQLSQSKNIINYKSNHNFVDDNWRYVRREEVKNYKLDYRIVYDGYSAIKTNYKGEVIGLADNAKIFISDIFSVANNLGFRNIQDPENRKWMPGVTQLFTYLATDTDYDDFCEIKAYKNGNLHFKFNQKFMRKLNVEAARLNGWIKSPEEAAEEMELPVNEVEEVFGINCQFRLRDIKLLEV